ncbi:hypothetical protein POM88_043437 [Heracleum sosnowskyi]|uniref:Uncharacterized protein n=1 Tax=Heracleum sosnowskyi TaxID=360622 RepID=A0AAD8H3C7_9APIA|nr:hypothetical protein POM88_043437 [Heracleum sosnowskyi]
MIIHSRQAQSRRHSVVVGITGMVGNSLAKIGHPGWSVESLWCSWSSRAWDAHYPVEYIQSDIPNPEETESRLSHLKDVIYLFYVSWASGLTEAENCEINS